MRSPLTRTARPATPTCTRSLRCSSPSAPSRWRARSWRSSAAPRRRPRPRRAGSPQAARCWRCTRSRRAPSGCSPEAARWTVARCSSSRCAWSSARSSPGRCAAPTSCWRRAPSRRAPRCRARCCPPRPCVSSRRRRWCPGAACSPATSRAALLRRSADPFTRATEQGEHRVPKPAIRPAGPRRRRHRRRVRPRAVGRQRQHGPAGQQRQQQHRQRYRRRPAPAGQRRRRQERQARGRHQAPHVQEGRHGRLHREARPRRRDPLPRLRHRQGRQGRRVRALHHARQDRRPLRGRARGPQGADRRGRGRAMSRRIALAAGAALAALVALPATAPPHGLVGRQDLPIPRWLFAWAAAVVLVASFVGLATLWPKPRLQVLKERVVARLPAIGEALCGAIGIALFVLVVYAGLAGNQTATANLTPTVVYVLFWVGIPFISALVGDVFSLFNPWRATARLVAWIASRVTRSLPEPLAYPQRLGRWPAAFGILAFAWVELVYVDRTDPSQLAIMALAYAAVMLVGMSLYGIEPWSTRADPFAVYFGLFARLSP